MRASGWTAAQTAAAKSIQIGQISFNAPAYTNSENGVGALDVNLSEKDSLRGRFILNRYGAIDTAAALPVFYTTLPNNDYLVAFSEFHTFSPTLTNEFRLGYNRNSNSYPVGNQKWPGLDQFPNINIFELGRAARSRPQRAAVRHPESIPGDREHELDQGHAQPEVRF